jgi:hypothetical protein
MAPISPDQRPEFHFLYLAPGAGVDYFFVGARRYWEIFRPTVIYDLTLVQRVPAERTVAITALARTDTVEMVRQLVATLLGEQVYLDLLVYDFLEDMQFTLDARAERNEPFGVPLS